MAIDSRITTDRLTIFTLGECSLEILPDGTHKVDCSINKDEMNDLATKIKYFLQEERLREK